jgi:hypothetical protein
MVQPAAELSFNPTAIALQFTGANADDVRNHLKNRTGKDYSPGLEEGMHYVVFMGEVYVLSDEQLRSAMGRV